MIVKRQGLVCTCRRKFQNEFEHRLALKHILLNNKNIALESAKACLDSKLKHKIYSFFADQMLHLNLILKTLLSQTFIFFSIHL